MDLDDLPREDEMVANQHRGSGGSFAFALMIVVAVFAVILGAVGLKMAADAGSRAADLEGRLSSLEAQIVEVGAVSGDLDESRLQLSDLELRMRDSERRTQSIAQQTQTAFDKVTTDLKNNRQAIAANNQNIAKIVESVGGSVVRSAGSSDSSVSRANATFGARDVPPSAEVSGGAAGQGFIEHEIVSGDMLSRLSERYNVKLSSIVEANPGIDPNRLKIGQIVRIPQ